MFKKILMEFVRNLTGNLFEINGKFSGVGEVVLR